MEVIQEDIQKLKLTHDIFNKLDMRIKISVGEAFEPVMYVPKLYGNDEKAHIERKEGQVLLINFWAEW